MTEAKLAPNLPGWMVDHTNRYLSSGGADGHMYKMTQPGRPEMTVPSLLLTTTGRKSGERFIFPLFYGTAGDGLFRDRLERRRTATPRLVSQHPRQPGRRGAGRGREDEGAGQNRHRRGARAAVAKVPGVLAALCRLPDARPSARSPWSCWTLSARGTGETAAGRRRFGSATTLCGAQLRWGRRLLLPVMASFVANCYSSCPSRHKLSFSNQSGINPLATGIII